MSGMTRSTPSISSSGNIRPQSTTTMSSPHSMAIIFLPISPRPPRGMTRNVGCGIRLEQTQLLGLGRLWLLGAGPLLPDFLQEVREFAHILFYGCPQTILVQGCRRMVHRKNEHAISFNRAAVDLADALARKPARHGGAAERHDDLGVDQRDLGV